MVVLWWFPPIFDSREREWCVCRWWWWWCSAWLQCITLIMHTWQRWKLRIVRCLTSSMAAHYGPGRSVFYLKICGNEEKFPTFHSTNISESSLPPQFLRLFKYILAGFVLVSNPMTSYFNWRMSRRLPGGYRIPCGPGLMPNDCRKYATFFPDSFSEMLLRFDDFELLG